MNRLRVWWATLKPHITLSNVLWALVVISIFWNIYDSATTDDMSELRFNAVLGWVMAGLWLSMAMVSRYYDNKMKKMFTDVLNDNMNLAIENRNYNRHFEAIKKSYEDTQVAPAEEEKPTSH